MAASSTNKQPLLVDRPLLAVESLTTSHAPVGALDASTGVAGVLLVDCTQNDGALISDIAAINRVASHTCDIALYLSRSSLTLGVNAASGGFGGLGIGVLKVPTGDQGVWTSLALPKLLGPVPHAGGNDANGRPPQFRGLPISRGWALWAAVIGTAPDANAPNIACVGGFY